MCHHHHHHHHVLLLNQVNLTSDRVSVAAADWQTRRKLGFWGDWREHWTHVLLIPNLGRIWKNGILVCFCVVIGLLGALSSSFGAVSIPSVAFNYVAFVLLFNACSCWCVTAARLKIHQVSYVQGTLWILNCASSLCLRTRLGVCEVLRCFILFCWFHARNGRNISTETPVTLADVLSLEFSSNINSVPCFTECYLCSTGVFTFGGCPDAAAKEHVPSLGSTCTKS